MPSREYSRTEQFGYQPGCLGLVQPKIEDNFSHLNFIVEPTVRVLVEDTKTMRPVGDSISLLCEVEGNPEPVLSWSLHDQTIIPVAGRIHISKGGQRYKFGWIDCFGIIPIVNKKTFSLFNQRNVFRKKTHFNRKNTFFG